MDTHKGDVILQYNLGILLMHDLNKYGQSRYKNGVTH